MCYVFVLMNGRSFVTALNQQQITAVLKLDSKYTVTKLLVGIAYNGLVAGTFTVSDEHKQQLRKFKSKLLQLTDPQSPLASKKACLTNSPKLALLLLQAYHGSTVCAN